MKDAKDNRDAVPTVQGNKRCNADPTDRRALHQDKGVFQHAHIQNERSSSDGAKTKTPTIRWEEWNPFERATGEALRQLNRRQRKRRIPDDNAPEALI
jgi:hypothetical protein